MLNKEVYINRRRKLKENFKDGLILIIGNDFSPLDCEDNTYPFIQDATFKYYFGIDHNGLIGIIDIDKNEEIIFHLLIVKIILIHLFKMQLLNIILA